MDTAEEKQLVSRAKRGELAAFEQLVATYEKRIYALAYRSSGNIQDAQDITQEVFLRVYRSLDRFRQNSSFGTWVYRITMNICVDFARHNAARPETVSLTQEDGERPLKDATALNQPEQAAENQELRIELHTALQLLSAEHREIVLLRDVADLSYTAIAAALEISEGTVKSRLARARNRLRDILLQRGNICVSAPSNQAQGKEAAT